jgi:hypothetical protein
VDAPFEAAPARVVNDHSNNNNNGDEEEGAEPKQKKNKRQKTKKREPAEPRARQKPAPPRKPHWELRAWLLCFGLFDVLFCKRYIEEKAFFLPPSPDRIGRRGAAKADIQTRGKK